MYRIITKIEINVPTEIVWDVLTDFDKYQDWNTQLYFISGFPELGQQLELKLEPMGHKGYHFKPTLHAMKPQKLLAWKGNVIAGGVFSVEHRFRLEKTELGSTILMNEEICKGLASPVMQMLPITQNTAASLDWLNEEINDRAMAIASKKMAS